MSILRTEDIATKSFVASAKDLFEQTAKTVVRTKVVKKYTMLNYEDILDKMCEYIESYNEYKRDGDDKYRGKVLNITKTYYDSIFTDDKYRKKLTLKDMSNVPGVFLKKTKALQTLLEKYCDKQDQDYELQQILIMTNNQYKKLSKVYKDDMEIFMWLATKDSHIVNEHTIPAQMRLNFYDPSTPVIHPAGLEKKGYINTDIDDDIEDDED